MDLCGASQNLGGDFAKLCGLLKIYELYKQTEFEKKDIQDIYENLYLLNGTKNKRKIIC